MKIIPSQQKFSFFKNENFDEFCCALEHHMNSYVIKISENLIEYFKETILSWKS